MRLGKCLRADQGSCRDFRCQLFCFATCGLGVFLAISSAQLVHALISETVKAAPVGVAELAQHIVRRDVADIVDEAVNGSLETGSAVDIDGLLTLQHQLRDESSSLKAVLETCRFNEAACGKSVDTILLKRISKYVEIGAAVLRYFSEDINDLLAAHSDRVLCVVEDLARAKAALAVSPAEAEWYLSRARTKMGLHPFRDFALRPGNRRQKK